MAWVLRRDARHVLVAVPIQSTRGCELLAAISPNERLRSAHAIAADGRLCSGGAAVAAVLSATERTRALGQLTRALPRTTALLYSVVAARRTSFGRLIGATSRRRADELLATADVAQTAEQGGSRALG